MAVLTAATRNKLPTSAFALPGKRAYPIHDPAHARNALSRAAQYATPAQQATIRAKVHARFPGIGQKKKKGALAGHMASLKLRGAFAGSQKGGGY
jgi:hypothetical protein